MTETGDALTALYAGHYHSLVRLATLLLDDVAACEDVVQEAFIRVYGTRRAVDDPLAYLRQTVVNLARSTLRRRLVAARHAPRPEAMTAEDPAYAAVRRDALVRAMRTLPRREREALALRYFADLTEAQTATAMGCAVGSVKGYTSRGLARLAERLEER